MVHRSVWLCAVLAACVLGVPAAQQAAYSLILGYNFMESTTLLDTMAEDVLTGMFLAFWNKVPLPDTRLVATNESVDDQLLLHVTLDSLSPSETENAKYWAADSRFFGMIMQLDHNAADNIVPLIFDYAFPFFAPYTGITVNVTQTYWRNAVMARESYVYDFVHLVDYAVNRRKKRRIGIVFPKSEITNTFDLAKPALDALDLSFAVNISTDGQSGGETEYMMKQCYNTMVENGVDAVIVAHHATAIRFFLQAAAQDKISSRPLILLSTVEIDSVLSVLSTLDPMDLVMATGIPTFNDTEHPLIQNFNACHKWWKRNDRKTYAMLEGFLYARFFLGGNITSTSFLESVFANETFDIDGMTFGPYVNSTKANEYCNVGLRQTYLWTMDEFKNLIYADPLPRTHPGCGNIYDLSINVSWVLSVLVPLIVAIVMASVPIAIWATLHSHELEYKLLDGSLTAYPVQSNLKSGDPFDPSPTPFHLSVVADVLKTKHNIMPISDAELVDMRFVGGGSSAQVYRAKWHGTNVAVKRLRRLSESLNTDTKIQSFAKEIKLWSQLKHPCIVEFFGVTPTLSIVMEYMQQGNLRDLLSKRPLASTTLTKLASQIAIAMDFLHSKNVLHRDLNPNNIMVTGPIDQLQAKLADFGMSTLKQEALKRTVTVGTPVFAAPEVLGACVFTEKSDVYSFGLTLWFMENIKDPFEKVSTTQQLFSAVVIHKERPSLKGCVLFPTLIQKCWDEDPAKRPTSTEIVDAIQAILNPHAAPAPRASSRS